MVTNSVVCQLCAFLWGAMAMGAAFYVVFFLDRSPWWMLAGIAIAAAWSCEDKHRES